MKSEDSWHGSWHIVDKEVLMDPNVAVLLTSRGLSVPTGDEVPLEEHWKKMRRLRQQVDEKLLADHEIAVTWTPLSEEDA